MDLGNCSFLDNETVLMDDTVNKVINLIKRTKAFEGLVRYFSALKVVIAGFMRFGIGYFTLSVNCRLVDHRLGTVRWSKNTT
jgi:hypothetical protein